MPPEPSGNPNVPRKPKSGIAVVGESAVRVIAEAMTSSDTGNGKTRKMETFKPFLQLSAAGLVFYGFYLYQSESLQSSREDRGFFQQQTREDRTLFRESITGMRDDSTKQWQAVSGNQSALTETTKALYGIQLNQAEISKNMQLLQKSQGEIVESLQSLQATTAVVAKAVRDLSGEVRDVSGKPPAPAKPPVKPLPVKPKPESRGGELLPLPRAG